MSNRLPVGAGSRGGRWHVPEHRQAYYRAWRYANPEYRERERLRKARQRAREKGGLDPAELVSSTAFPRPLPRPVATCACPCGCEETIILHACGFCITGLHRNET